MKLFKEKKYRKYFLVPFIFLGIIAVTGSCGGGGSGGGGTLTPTGKLYVSGCSTNSILSYDNANSVSGSATVSRTIIGAATTLSTQGGIFVDVANDRLYVANASANSILVFNNASTRNGNTAPDRTIAGAATTLNGPADVFLDVTNDRLYVANYTADSILVFNNASTANGDIAPDRTVAGAATSLDGPAGIYVDTTRNILYIANYTGSVILSYNNAGTVSGDFGPSRTIASSTALNNPEGIFVDVANNRLYVADPDSSYISVFNNASTRWGDILPDRRIAGIPSYTPRDVFVDVANDRLYVANYDTDSILVFNNASTADADVAPNRTISLPNGTGPVSVFIDTTR